MSLDDRTKRLLPWLVAIAFFMQTLDGSILNTALPAMAAFILFQLGRGEGAGGAPTVPAEG